ncbi:CyP450 monooxygenase [Daedaleopsis nitida]|nr:CyP450 monooxygenase [Daedaleopsis nitida]
MFFTQLTTVLNYGPSAVRLAGLLLVAIVLSRVALAQIAWYNRRRGRPLPPGPKALPFIGNISVLRQSDLWSVFRDLCSIHGDILHLPVLGQNLVVLGSPQAIFELLDKQSADTSDRPQSPLIQLAGQDSNFAIFPYGAWWRRHRRAFWQHFLPGGLAKHYPSQQDAALLFLRKLLSDPTRLCDHIRYTFASAIFDVTYGVQVADEGDTRIALIEKTIEGGQAFTPGRYLVELLPFLRYVPEWMPGAGFQREFAAWRDAAHSFTETMFKESEEGLARGTTSHSIVASLLGGTGDDGRKNAQAMSEEDARVIKAVGFTTCEAGADTTFSTLQVFFQAMALHPDAQKAAQAELDAVVGPDRLPDHSDRATLPYLNALVKECLRWQNVLPVGLPHLTTEDLEYKGYFIPRGSVLIPNTWACLHDPMAYPDPEIFAPERFLRDGRLDPNVCDPARFAFGYGRRICPGRYYADAALFINIAMVLHVFDITPPPGSDVDSERNGFKMTGGLLSYPKDCRCTITPRSAQAKDLILSGSVHG